MPAIIPNLERNVEPVRVAEVGYDGLQRALKRIGQEGGQVKIKGPTIDTVVGSGAAKFLVGIPQEGVDYEATKQAGKQDELGLLDELLGSRLLVRSGNRVTVVPGVGKYTYTVFAYYVKD